MSNDVLGVNYEALDMGKKNITEAADMFHNLYVEMYSVVDALVESEWKSPAATAIANKIHGQRANLDEMYKILLGYAGFCDYTVNRVTDNEESIIAGVGGANNG